LKSDGFKEKSFEFVEMNATMAKVLGNNSYIAAEIENPLNITIGDGQYYNGYYNAPLDPNTAYRVFVRIATMTRDKVCGQCCRSFSQFIDCVYVLCGKPYLRIGFLIYWTIFLF